MFVSICIINDGIGSINHVDVDYIHNDGNGDKDDDDSDNEDDAEDCGNKREFHKEIVFVKQKAY